MSLDLFNAISIFVDEYLYKPRYIKERKSENIKFFVKSFHRTYLEVMERKLKPLKCISFISSFGCLFYGLNNFASANIGNSILYGILCFDLFNISYNCYISKYIQNVVEDLSSSVSSISENILNYIKGENPMQKYNEIKLHLLLKDTVIIKVIGSVNKYKSISR